MTNDFSVPWTVLLQLINFLLPLVTLCAVYSAILALLAIVDATDEKYEFQWTDYLYRTSFIFAFCLVGAVVGIIIYLIGGFTANDGDQLGPFKMISTLVTAFLGIYGLFYGETSSEASQGARPLGTASGVFFMVAGYFYYIGIAGEIIGNSG